jgi:hypothetical protein
LSLVWKWLTGGEVSQLDCDRPINLPALPGGSLTRIAV